MASQIDPGKPIFGEPTTESVRSNFEHARVEITDLEDRIELLEEAGGGEGPPGPPGQAATIDVGNTVTGPPGSSAVVSNRGTTSAAIFDFMIPRGDPGAGGEGPGGDLSEYLRLDGGVMTGDLLLAGDPSAALSAVPRQYVDGLVSGIAQLIGIINADTGNVTYSMASGFPSGGPLVEAETAGHGAYVLCGEPGTVPGGPIDGETLTTGDWVISNGEEWVILSVALRTMLAANVGLIPEVLGADNVQAALETIATNFLDKRAANQLAQILISANGGGAASVGLGIGDNTTGFYRSGGALAIAFGGEMYAQIVANQIMFLKDLNMATLARITNIMDPLNAGDAVNLRHFTANSLPDAPRDNVAYARKNGAWAPAVNASTFFYEVLFTSTGAEEIGTEYSWTIPAEALPDQPFDWICQGNGFGTFAFTDQILEGAPSGLWMALLLADWGDGRLWRNAATATGLTVFVAQAHNVLRPGGNPLRWQHYDPSDGGIEFGLRCTATPNTGPFSLIFAIQGQIVSFGEPATFYGVEPRLAEARRRAAQS